MSDRDPMFDASFDALQDAEPQEPEAEPESPDLPTEPSLDYEPEEPEPDEEPEGEPEEPEGEGDDEPLLAGKYKSVEDLERGFNDSARDLELARAARQLAEEKARWLEEQTKRYGQPQPTEDPFKAEREALKDAGYDDKLVDTILGLAEKAAAAKVPSELQTSLSPLFNSAAARQGFSLQQQQKLDQLLASDPEFANVYNRAVMTDPEQAKQFAQMRMKIDETIEQARASSDAIKAKRKQAKKDGTSVPRRTSQGRETPNKSQQAQAREERLDKLFKSAQRTGDTNPLARELFSGLEIWDESGRRRLK